ncbi:MAG TPA: hypothetical protein VN227_05950 [Methanoregula sp.]|nr:hypothetical protein [Methanoregula sp.]
MHNRFLKLIGACLFIIILVVTAVLISSVVFPKEAVIAPHIAPDLTRLQSSPMIISHQFPFEKTTISLTVPINVSVYEGARQAEKATTVYGNISETVWLAQSYRALVKDPSQDSLYTAILAEAGKIRLQENLSDDEYFELITVYTQSLKYETREQNPAKFPVETVVDLAGDCDDKSLLLAGLLSREGYPVALLLFGPESHMAVGVGSDKYLYKNTGYTFVETTNYSFVGVPTEKLGGNLTLYSDPVIIPISNGTKFYTSGSETRYIHDMYVLSDLKVKELEPQVKNMESDLTYQKEKIAQLKLHIQEIRNTGNSNSYNAQVAVHNALVSDYNSRLNVYRELFSRYEKYALIHNYILEHMYDRKGVFEYVQKNMPA